MDKYCIMRRKCKSMCFSCHGIKHQQLTGLQDLQDLLIRSAGKRMMLKSFLHMLMCSATHPGTFFGEDHFVGLVHRCCCLGYVVLWRFSNLYAFALRNCYLTLVASPAGFATLIPPK